MAESAVGFLLEKLGNLVIQEASLFGQVEVQVRLLCNELEWMRLFLKEAGATRTYNNRLRLWMNQIRDAAYDAEDVIDEFMFKVERRRRRLDNLKLLKILPTWVSFLDKLPFIHELDARITEINVKIDKILVNKWRYGVENLVLVPEVWNNNASTVRSWRERRAPIVEEEDVVGMGNDVTAVKGMLIGGERRREVVAIVGMGGLGKTTIAKKVYNDDDVKKHFNCHAWVYVSQKYRIRELLMEVIHFVMPLTDAKRSQISMMGEKELGGKLSDYLKEKQYLIVLDDIWSFDIWRVLSPSYFPQSDNGSRVLITTRNQEIASGANADVLQLRHLNPRESWKLFLKKTFQVRSTSGVCPQELKNLGKSIAGKCRGLPLAIVVIGGLLARKEKTRSSWERVLQGIEWHLDQGPESCLGILALSYNDLPFYLKSCFLYCCIFPKDHKIKATKLINFWVAEGFVQRRGKETMEDIAQDYLEELIQRSMIRVAKRKSDGTVKSCYIHELLHDLAISEAQDSNFYEVYENINFTSPISIRRLTIHQKHNISRHLRTSRLRSLICFSTYIEQKTLTSILVLKLLTALDLPRPNEVDQLTTLPEEIGNLVHLKHLCLQGWRIRSLPLSIGRLVNLQTLDLQSSEVKSIPCTIWKLHQLRHLYGSPDMIVISESMMRRCLTDHSHDSRIDELTDLQTLYLRSGSWLQNGRLQKLIQLRKLKLYGWFNNFSELYPPNLTKLELKNTRLLEDPTTILGRLRNLRVLKLTCFAYLGKKLVLPSGGFLRLELLKLDWLHLLEKLVMGEGAIPVLRILQINKCSKLERLPQGFWRLEYLTIQRDGRLEKIGTKFVLSH